jgi:hypothetical protein
VRAAGFPVGRVSEQGAPGGVLVVADADFGAAVEDVGERSRDCVPLGAAFPGCGRQRVPLGAPRDPKCPR